MNRCDKPYGNPSFRRGRFLPLLAACMLMLVPAGAGAQTREGRFTFTYSNVSLLDVLRDMNRVSGNQIVYKVEQIEQEKTPVTINLPNATVMQGVTAALRGRNLTAVERDGQVIIAPAGQNNAAAQGPVTLTGSVRNSAGAPMAGVAVIVKGSSTGSVTDGTGRFSYTVQSPPSPLVVEFHFLGMETVEVVYTGQASIDVVMQDAASEIETVVVTGIFDKPKESYTGAVTSMSRKDLEYAGNRSLLASIRNIDPSFNIIDDISMGSDPNSMPNITIRGNSSLDANVSDLQSDTRNRTNLPLFIKDGFEISQTQFMDLDQNIIESVTLLKDASATAMYGTRGANGVVVITTRKPEAGQLRVTYKGSLTMEAPMLGSYDLMNSREKLAFEREAGLYSAYSPLAQMELTELYNSRLADVERGVDTYWIKYPVRTSVGHRHSLRIEGGREEILYAANLAYDNIAGAMKGSYRNTFNGDIYLAYTYKNVSFKNNLIVSFNNSANSPYGKFSDYAAINSYWKPYDDEGNLLKILATQNYGASLGNSHQGQIAYNPLWNAKQPSIDGSKYTQIQNNFEINWDITRDLVMRGKFGYTNNDSRADVYNSAEHTKFASYTSEEDFGRRGEYILTTGKSRTAEVSLSLNYNKVFNDVHQLYAGVYGNFSDKSTDFYTIKGEGISNPQLDYIGAATLYEKGGKPVATEGITRRLGGTLNVNYTYDRRYFADLTGTVEGSSMYGSDNRAAPFFSLGAGWNIHAERFLANSAAIDIARLRVSYGTSGSQSFSPYQALTTYQSYGDVHYNQWYGSYLMGMGNPDLGWQKTATLNAGFDLELFKRRIRISADFYNKTTDGVLADVTLPSAAGFVTYKANVGKLENRGVELNVSAYLIRNSEKQLRWLVSGSMIHNRNKITKISNALEFLNETMLENDGINPSFLFKEGESINTIYAVRSLGIDPSNGNELFLDRFGNVTDTWNEQDKVACGVTDPKLWGNFNTSFSWKNLTFNAVFSYTLGGKYYNQTLANRVENIAPYQNVDRRALYDRWREPGDMAMFKRITDRSATNATTRFVMKNNTLSCSTLSLHYDFENNAWLDRNLGLSFLSVGIYTEDVFRISTIKQERGLTYPFSKKFSLSVTARF